MDENSTARFQPEDLEKLRKLFVEILQSPCWNEVTSANKTETGEKKSSEDPMAVVYITLILLIFGTSLLILLVKYLRKERESAKLQRFYDDYLDTRLPSMVVHYDEEGRCIKTKTSRKTSRRSNNLSLDLSSPGQSSAGDTPMTSSPMTSSACTSPLVTPDAMATTNTSIMKKALLEHVV